MTKVTTADDPDLIELAYASCFTAMCEWSNEPWTEPLGEQTPADIEKECYRLSSKLGFRPLYETKSLEEVDAHWRRQLKTGRQHDLLSIGMLLVRQHGLLSALQCHPNREERPEICYYLDEIRRELLALLDKNGVRAAVAKMPEIPLPGSSDSWMEWSGDALRDAILEELRR